MLPVGVSSAFHLQGLAECLVPIVVLEGLLDHPALPIASVCVFLSEKLHLLIDLSIAVLHHVKLRVLLVVNQAVKVGVYARCVSSHR